MGNNAFIILNSNNEMQPDVLLRKKDGACSLDMDGYSLGPPQIFGEISCTGSNLDSNQDKEVYRRCGVQEHIVWNTRTNRLEWFVFDNERYNNVDHVSRLMKSEMSPRLVLNMITLIERDSVNVILILMTAINKRNRV